MGVTIGATIGCVLKGKSNTAFQKHLNEIGFAQGISGSLVNIQAMKNAAIFDGGTSKSNGSLMRCSPIGIYGYKLTDEEIAFIASEDTRLSHPNQTVCDAVSAYCIALAELVKSGDSK